MQANSVQCTVCKKLTHKRCSGDMSRELTVSGVGDVTKQPKKLI